MWANFHSKPLAGLEPATPRLEVWCAIHCATGANFPDMGLEPMTSRLKVCHSTN